MGCFTRVLWSVLFRVPECVSLYPRAVIAGRSLAVVYASRVPLLYESLYHFVHLFVVFRSEVVPREKGLWFRGSPKVGQPPKLEVWELKIEYWRWDSTRRVCVCSLHDKLLIFRASRFCRCVYFLFSCLKIGNSQVPTKEFYLLRIDGNSAKLIWRFPNVTGGLNKLTKWKARWLPFLKHTDFCTTPLIASQLLFWHTSLDWNPPVRTSAVSHHDSFYFQPTQF